VKKETRALFLGHRLGQFEQALETLRKPGAVLRDTAGAANLGRVRQI
jgi:hypothetical protein